MLHKKHPQAFTLVELIVVVTILAILATIGFVSYSSYLTGVRDTNRLSQLVSISDGLELYRTKKDLPLPDDNIEVQANGTTIAYQGYAGSNTLETIDFTKGGEDPKDDSYFTYYLTEDRKYFQLLGFLEEEENLSSQNNNTPNISRSYAADYSNRLPTVYGKKLGVLTNAQNTPVQELETGLVNFDGTGTEYVAHLDDSTSVTSSGAIILQGTLSHTAGKSQKSCKSILGENPLAQGLDGEYWITLGGESFKVYCDMTRSLGGWTLIKRIGSLGRNGKISSDRIGIIGVDAQMGKLSDLRPDGDQFAKMSDAKINSIDFTEQMFEQDGSTDLIFVFTSSVDSDLLVTASTSFSYKVGEAGTVLTSSLSAGTGGCTKRGVYISTGGAIDCGGATILSESGYIHTFDNNGFGINTGVYANQKGTIWVR